jgi:hypothetical protein
MKTLCVLVFVTSLFCLSQTQVSPLQIKGLPNFADDEVPAGVYDGVNTVFTLAHAPNPAASLKLALNGVQVQRGLDYTVAGSIVTFSGIQTGSLVVLTASPSASDSITSFTSAATAPAGATPVVGAMVPMIPGVGDRVLANYRY